MSALLTRKLWCVSLSRSCRCSASLLIPGRPSSSTTVTAVDVDDSSGGTSGSSSGGSSSNEARHVPRLRRLADMAAVRRARNHSDTIIRDRGIALLRNPQTNKVAYLLVSPGTLTLHPNPIPEVTPTLTSRHACHSHRPPSSPRLPTAVSGTKVCLYTWHTGFVSCKKKNRNAENMASAGARAYMGVWGRCPQRGPGAEPLVRGLGGRSPLKLKAFWSLHVQRSRQI